MLGKGLELCLYPFRPFPLELEGTIPNVYSLQCCLANYERKKPPVVDLITGGKLGISVTFSVPAQLPVISSETKPDLMMRSTSTS